MIINFSQKPIFVICGGIHSPHITACFVNSFSQIIEGIFPHNLCIIPTLRIAPYDILSIYHFLYQECGQPKQCSPLIFIGFSAGVVGSIGVSRLWQRKGGIVQSLFAFDGWGVPLIADFPCYRLSHDYFTHLSSQILGGEKNAFYAQPSVSHLDFWRSPEIVQGYYQKKNGQEKITALEFIRLMLRKKNSN